MANRYKIVSYEAAFSFDDPEEWLEYYDAEFAGFLVDLYEGKVVFCDKCEPEDATLNRHFYPIVELLNAISDIPSSCSCGTAAECKCG